jgi:SNF2 family DNA or RNA helicase
MLAIHGVWSDGRLLLWAEDADRIGLRAGPRPAGSPDDARQHPFAASTGLLADTLAEFGEQAADLARKATETDLVLWLPATAAGPLSSPDAEAANVAAVGSSDPADTAADDIHTGNGHVSPAVASTRRPDRLTLHPWQVPAVSFDPAAALPLLTAIGQPGARGERGVLGGSVQLLAAIALLAADLTVRGRVLPGLDKTEEASGAGDVGGPGDVRSAGDVGGAGDASRPNDAGHIARWRPVLAGADALRARELTLALPPLCRATSAAGEPSAPLVADALGLLTDAAVRARLAASPGFALVPANPSAPLTDRWAAALTSTGGQFPVASAEIAKAAQLAFALWAWQDAAQEPPGPVRTCFRLIEPDQPPSPADSLSLADSPSAADSLSQAHPIGQAGPDVQTDGDARADWRVEFALQATDDPSLLLPAADIWFGGTADGWAAAGISYPEDDLLAGLGRASRLFPELDRELQNPTPAEVALDTRAALRFLKETGPMLAAAGFGVLLPDWVRRSRLGLRLTTRSRTAAAPGSVTAPKFGLADLVDFRYELAIGDETLAPDELAELARLKVPLVRIRGQWVELDERHLNAALKFLERRGSGVMTAGDALQAGLGESAGDLPLAAVDADGWLGDLLSGQAERRLEPMSTPESFRGALRPYQERGLAWLSFLGKLGLGAVLADDMGLGKSPQTLALLQAERDAGTSAGPTLLICPMSLVGNWQREAARFTPALTVHVHHGADRLAGPELAAAVGAADLVITTYGVATRDRVALAAVPWARVVCDEAQNIKNASTRQAQAVRAIPAAARIALTGTPVENRLTELWSIMEFTSPGLLGPAERFRRRFAIPIERNSDAEATDQLKRMTGPFILRRLKTDKSVIADLPDKLEMKVWCNLTPEQASLYQATVDDMMARIEAAEPGIERRGLVLATMAKLKQVCNHPAHLLGDGSRLAGRSGKLARLEEICDEIIEAGDKALCFTQYAEFGRMLQPYLAARLGCDVHFLHGGTTKKRRDEMVSEFSEGAGPAVFLLSLKAGGTGLNLTAASHVIHVDRWWNPAVEDQATDRAFRIGQRRDVQVRKFVCVGTVEERIDQMIEDKKALAETIIGTGESWLTELSVADLRRVIDLSPEAVSQ